VYTTTGTRIPDPPFFSLLIGSLPRLWYGSLSVSISLNHLSIFYNSSCYNSLVLLTIVYRSSCRITYICSRSSCRITYIYVYISNTAAGPRNKKLEERESCNTKCCKIWINGSKIYFQTKIHTIFAGGTKWGKRGVRNSSACVSISGVIAFLSVSCWPLLTTIYIVFNLCNDGWRSNK
jgi:hypothetical protein